MSTTAQILKDTRSGMEKAVENSKREFSGIRSGKASPNMLDVVKVEAYGSMLPLNQVASVSAPEPRILLVTPFDKGMAKVIEKAIRESELGLDPAHQGGIIRVPLPSMTEQRRKELVKVLHKLAEDGRIAIRHARTDARDKVKKLDGTSEDEKKSAEKELQKIHDDFIGRLDALLKTKEAEIMEV
jgi:ribosome recycling factor